MHSYMPTAGASIDTPLLQVWGASTPLKTALMSISGKVCAEVCPEQAVASFPGFLSRWTPEFSYRVRSPSSSHIISSRKGSADLEIETLKRTAGHKYLGQGLSGRQD